MTLLSVIVFRCRQKGKDKKRERHICAGLFPSYFVGVLIFRLLYPERLVLEPALKIHSGIGGVIFLSSPSVVTSSSSRSSGDALSTLRWKDSNDPCVLRGLGTAGRLPLRIRARLRMLFLSEMTWPALGEATSIVPGVTAGGGVGESVRNRGWM